MREAEAERTAEDAAEDEGDADKKEAETSIRPAFWVITAGWIGLLAWYSYFIFSSFREDRLSPSTSVSFVTASESEGLALPVVTVCNEALGKTGSSVISFDRYFRPRSLPPMAFGA